MDHPGRDAVDFVNRPAVGQELAPGRALRCSPHPFDEPVRPIAPEIRATSRPCSRIANVGMLRMSNFAATLRLIGVQLHESHSAARPRAARSNTGAIAHGRTTAPEIHDDRQIRCATWRSKSASASSTGCPLKSGRLHVPHLGASPSRAGTRLAVWQ
jgi:hypothetical protein